MRILLVLASSPTDPLRRNDPFMPLALPLLAATAPDHDYRLVDLLWDDPRDLPGDVDLVGISMRYTAETEAYRIAERYRRKGIPVVIGGPQASAVPLRALRHASAVAVGEGEPLWPVIVRDAEAGNLKDLYVCSPGTFDAPDGLRVHQVHEYPDLATIPRAHRHRMRRRYRFDTVFAVRGCPIDCDFCAVPSMFGRTFRRRPVEEVVAEIDTFRGYYYLLDDTVFGKPATYDYYLDLYRRIGELSRRRFFIGQGNLDAVADPRGREVIQAAVKAGLLYVMVGMESINPATLQASGAVRKMGVRDAQDPVQRMAEHVRWLQEQGLIVSGWFVVGYEGDDLGTWQRTLDFCRAHGILPVIFPIKALPGTRLHDRLDREGRLDDRRFLNLRHPGLDDEALVAEWRRVSREGYRFRERWARTAFYRAFFRHLPPQDRVHHLLFTWILQAKMGQGLMHDEFYLEPRDPENGLDGQTEDPAPDGR
ncbi:MAG TPA: radical SAM protein [Myxococcota bacterium]|nr:radical SAM protein [Myxococcota bacterium]HQK52566.1 radical SAM protein [Myxococcota bacterium]